jgi:serine/threonine protein kinase/Flp pilus assembly protein TadD
MSEPPTRDDDSFLQQGGARRGELWQEMSAQRAEREHPKLAVGSELSHFRILAEIGAGGMGIVYRAEDLRLGREVALKVLPPRALADPMRRARFLREARAASALNHPSIVTIYEIGSERGVDFIAMELLEGQTLRDALRTGALPASVAIGHGADIARGLAAAHEKGIVHRDLKPENLFVGKEGRVKILDFGLAKQFHEGETRGEASDPTRISESGAILGTVGYMSPEQARGREADHRSDLFSLGAILYEMLTGRRAFRGDSVVETLHAILNQDPPALSGSGTSYPAGLDRIVANCLAKEPAQRFQSARDFALALEAVSSAPTLAPAPRSSWRRQAALPLGLAAVALVIAALVSLDVGGRRRPAGGPAGASAISSIAVLPLQNLSGDAEQEYFADGMTDALIGNLAKVGALRVISRTSSMRYKATKSSLPQIAQELNVDAVVEGSVLRSGRRVRINARLSHAPTDRSLWSESYERDLHDVLALQRELAEAITRQIRVTLTQEERARIAIAPAVDPDVYEAYLKGRHHLARRTEEDARTAVRYFKDALGRDPRYAPAYAGLSSCYTLLSSVLIGRPPNETRPLAEAAAQRALEIDDGLAEAHASLAILRLFNWDWTGAELGFRRAIRLNPSLTEAHTGLSQNLIARGRFDEALSEARRAEEIDPLWPRTGDQVGYVLLNARRYDEAIRQYRSVLAREPNYTSARWFLGVSLAESSRFDEAIAELEAAVGNSGRSPVVLASLGAVYARSGRRAEAVAIRDELTALEKRAYVTPAAFVLLYAALGDKDRAFEWLETAVRERTNVTTFLAVFPPLDPLRSDPRFQELLKRIGHTS